MEVLQLQKIHDLNEIKGSTQIYLTHHNASQSEVMELELDQRNEMIII